MFGRCGDAVGCHDFGFEPIGCECKAAAGGGECVDIQHRHVHVGIATLDRGAKYARAATEVEQVTCGQAVQIFQ